MAIAATASAETGSAPDLAFRAQVTQFVQAELQLYPERSTHLGDHRFDDRVDDVSARGIDEVIRHAKKWMALFGADDPKSLSAANEADREWLVAHTDGEGHHAVDATLETGRSLNALLEKIASLYPQQAAAKAVGK